MSLGNNVFRALKVKNERITGLRGFVGLGLVLGLVLCSEKGLVYL